LKRENRHSQDTRRGRGNHQSQRPKKGGMLSSEMFKKKKRECVLKIAEDLLRKKKETVKERFGAAISE